MVYGKRKWSLPPSCKTVVLKPKTLKIGPATKRIFYADIPAVEFSRSNSTHRVISFSLLNQNMISSFDETYMKPAISRKS